MDSTTVMTREHLPADRMVHRAEVYGVDGFRRTLRPVCPVGMRAIVELVRPYAKRRTLIVRNLISYSEDIQEFTVIEEIPGVVEPGRADNGDTSAASRIVGCGALHVMWDDIVKVRTLTVHPGALGTGLGSAILRELTAQAREMGLRRAFCMTFEEQFFGAHGLEPIEDTPVSADVFAEILRPHSDGLARFLDLVRVKPSTLSNARMLLHLRTDHLEWAGCGSLRHAAVLCDLVVGYDPIRQTADSCATARRQPWRNTHDPQRSRTHH